MYQVGVSFTINSKLVISIERWVIFFSDTTTNYSTYPGELLGPLLRVSDPDSWAQLSAPQNWTLGPNCTGPNCPGPNCPIGKEPFRGYPPPFYAHIPQTKFDTIPRGSLWMIKWMTFKYLYCKFSFILRLYLTLKWCQNLQMSSVPKICNMPPTPPPPPKLGVGLDRQFWHPQTFLAGF